LLGTDSHSFVRVDGNVPSARIQRDLARNFVETQAGYGRTIKRDGGCGVELISNSDSRAQATGDQFTFQGGNSVTGIFSG
jgi:hypothetical protein